MVLLLSRAYPIWNAILREVCPQVQYIFLCVCVCVCVGFFFSLCFSKFYLYFHILLCISRLVLLTFWCYISFYTFLLRITTTKKLLFFVVLAILIMYTYVYITNGGNNIDAYLKSIPAAHILPCHIVTLSLMEFFFFFSLGILYIRVNRGGMMNEILIWRVLCIMNE